MCVHPPLTQTRPPNPPPLAPQNNFWALGATGYNKWALPDNQMHSPRTSPRGAPVHASSQPPVWAWAGDGTQETATPPPAVSKSGYAPTAYPASRWGWGGVRGGEGCRLALTPPAHWRPRSCGVKAAPGAVGCSQPSAARCRGRVGAACGSHWLLQGAVVASSPTCLRRCHALRGWAGAPRKAPVRNTALEASRARLHTPHFFVAPSHQGVRAWRGGGSSCNPLPPAPGAHHPHPHMTCMAAGPRRLPPLPCTRTSLRTGRRASSSRCRRQRRPPATGATRAAPQAQRWQRCAHAPSPTALRLWGRLDARVQALPWATALDSSRGCRRQRSRPGGHILVCARSLIPWPTHTRTRCLAPTAPGAAMGNRPGCAAAATAQLWPQAHGQARPCSARPAQAGGQHHLEVGRSVIILGSERRASWLWGWWEGALGGELVSGPLCLAGPMVGV